jgi:hypothetical protein
VKQEPLMGPYRGTDPQGRREEPCRRGGMAKSSNVPSSQKLAGRACQCASGEEKHAYTDRGGWRGYLPPPPPRPPPLRGPCSQPVRAHHGVLCDAVRIARQPQDEGRVIDECLSRLLVASWTPNETTDAPLRGHASTKKLSLLPVCSKKKRGP